MRTTAFTFFSSVVKRYRVRYSLIAFFEILQAASGISAPLVFGLLIDAIGKRDTSSTIQIILLSIFLALILGDMLFSRISGGMFVRTLAHQRHWAVERLYERVLCYPRTFYLQRSAALISHRISETSVAVNQILGCAIFDFWPMTVALCFAAAMLFSASVWLGMFMLTWISIFFCASLYFAKNGGDRALQAAKRENETNAHVSDALQNHLIVSLFDGSARELKRLEAIRAKEMAAIDPSNNYFELVRWVQFGAMATLAIVVVTLSFSLYLHDKIGIALLTMAIGLIVNIINYTHNLSQRLADFFGFWGRLNDGVTDLLAHDTTEKCTCAAHEPMRSCDIQFERVEFSYQDDRHIIKNLTLNIPAGQKIGIVGASGAGKSTILGLLLKLHAPTSGRIYLGDESIDTICARKLRCNIAVIPQEALLFNRSVLENLQYGDRHADSADVRCAAKLADAHEFINALPASYDTLIGCDGVALSGGERQRIAIARAFVKDAPILIADEATANLDPLAEEAIRDALLRIDTSKTVLVVAHRLRMVARLDRIIVLDEGTVVEDGTHDELIARGGLYRVLWDLESERATHPQPRP